MNTFKMLFILLYALSLLSCGKKTTEPNDSNTVKAPVFSPASGTYNIGQQITISCATDGVEIRYTLDDVEPTSESELYISTLSIPQIFINGANTCSIKAKAFKLGLPASNTTSANYTINYSNTVATPVISPSNGTFNNNDVQISISCLTTGAQIRYTTNGNEPNYLSPLYTNPITDISPLIKAKAFKPTWNPSNTVSATYVVPFYFVGNLDTPGSAREVTINGNYAYIADADSGLRIIDISNRNNPIETGFCDALGNATGVAIGGNYAYVATVDFQTYNDTGLRVININNPSNPFQVGYCHTPDHAWKVAIKGNYAYIADYSAGLRVINISNPNNPVEVGYCNTPGYAYGITINGNFAYVSTGLGMSIFDISISSNPVYIGLCSTPDTAYAATISGNYAYVAFSDGLRIFDISNPNTPIDAGYYYTHNSAYAIAINGNYAYVADGVSGLRFINISNPSNPVELGYYNTPGSVNGVVFRENYAYIADGDSGLSIITCDLKCK